MKKTILLSLFAVLLTITVIDTLQAQEAIYKKNEYGIEEKVSYIENNPTEYIIYKKNDYGMYERDLSIKKINNYDNDSRGIECGTKYNGVQDNEYNLWNGTSSVDNIFNDILRNTNESINDNNKSIGSSVYLNFLKLE